MFASPVACLQHIVYRAPLSLPTEPAIPTEQLDFGSSHPKETTTIPFLADPEYQTCVDCVAEQDGCLLASFDCAMPGYFIGQTPLTAGKYTWKVSYCLQWKWRGRGGEGGSREGGREQNFVL